MNVFFCYHREIKVEIGDFFGINGPLQPIKAKHTEEKQSNDYPTDCAKK